MVSRGIDKTMNGELVTEIYMSDESMVYTWELSDTLNLSNDRIFLPNAVVVKRKDVTRFTLGSRSLV